jgi:hypothetical protein
VKFGDNLLFFLSIQSSTSFQSYWSGAAWGGRPDATQSKVPKWQVTGKKTMTTNYEH